METSTARWNLPVIGDSSHGRGRGESQNAKSPLRVLDTLISKATLGTIISDDFCRSSMAEGGLGIHRSHLARSRRGRTNPEPPSCAPPVATSRFEEHSGPGWDARPGYCSVSRC